MRLRIGIVDVFLKASFELAEHVVEISLLIAGLLVLTKHSGVLKDFFEKGQLQIAATVLRRAVESDGSDQEKIGLLYLLGRCDEDQSKTAEALGYYQRVFAIDVGFEDVGERVDALAKVVG